MRDDSTISMPGFRRVCVEIGVALVLAVVTGVATRWALPIALLLFTLAGLTVVVEREEQAHLELVEEAAPVAEEPVVEQVAPTPSSALVPYRPPGPLMRR